MAEASSEVQIITQMQPGDRIIIERADLAGWIVTVGNSFNSPQTGRRAAFSDAKDVKAYLSRCLDAAKTFPREDKQ